MGKRSGYVDVPRETLLNFLKEKGFTQESEGGEIVYSRSHEKNPHVKVKVYTSLSENALFARGCGEDAIRILTFYHNPNTGARKKISDQPRVYRSGTVEGVLSRMYERMRNAYQDGTNWLNAPKPWDKKDKR
jgi:hypothetical protein